MEVHIVTLIFNANYFLEILNSFAMPVRTLVFYTNVTSQ